jgi:molybdopterin synthase sulfur carrier subunit
MKVNLFATLRQLAGGKTVELPPRDGCTVRVLLADLAAAYPRLGAELLDESGNLQSHMHLFVNGRETLYLPQGLETPVGPDDIVNIFPPVAGGAHDR